MWEKDKPETQVQGRASAADLIGSILRTARFLSVAKATPRVTRFIGQLSNRVPVWIVCRSQYAQEIGHLWKLLYRFTQIELPPLTVGETRTVLEAAVASQSVQADVLGYFTPLYHLCRGNPRMLEELLVELSARRYRVSNTAGRHLLEIDREIHFFERAWRSPHKNSRTEPRTMVRPTLRPKNSGARFLIAPPQKSINTPAKTYNDCASGRSRIK